MELLKEAEALRKVPMFAKLDSPKLKLLAFTSELLSFDDGEVLFEEGDAADCTYVILHGEVEILAKTDRGAVAYSTLGENKLLGELAVLCNAPRAATVRAKGALQVLRITDEMFLKLVTENPDVALDVMRQLSDKLTITHRQVEALEGQLQRD